MVEISPIVVAENVSFSYVTGQNYTEAIKDISFTIHKGEFVSFIGPSGCGKTTLLRLIANLLIPTDGKLFINGKSPELARKEHDFSFMFQEPALLEWRTSLKNITLPLELSGKDNTEAINISKNLMSLVGLEGFEDHFPRQLSGGMRQRVSIARALTLEPPLLLMDEPFAALDQITRHRMNFELLRIWSTTDSTVLFVTHNIREAVLLSDRVFVFKSQPGRIMEIIDINLPRPRYLELTDTSEFNELHVLGERLLEEAIHEVIEN